MGERVQQFTARLENDNGILKLAGSDMSDSTLCVFVMDGMRPSQKELATGFESKLTQHTLTTLMADLVALEGRERTGARHTAYTAAQPPAPNLAQPDVATLVERKQEMEQAFAAAAIHPLRDRSPSGIYERPERPRREQQPVMRQSLPIAMTNPAIWLSTV